MQLWSEKTRTQADVSVAKLFNHDTHRSLFFDD